MDMASWAEELGMEEADARRLVSIFLDTTERDLLLLQEAISARDAEKVRSTAHHIKGAAGNLDLDLIARAALELEEKAGSGVFEAEAPQILLIRGELQSIRAALSRW
jgi:two-component system sensor histidine kinase TorS